MIRYSLEAKTFQIRCQHCTTALLITTSLVRVNIVYSPKSEQQQHELHLTFTQNGTSVNSDILSPLNDFYSICSTFLCRVISLQLLVFIGRIYPLQLPWLVVDYFCCVNSLAECKRSSASLVFIWSRFSHCLVLFS